MPTHRREKFPPPDHSALGLERSVFFSDAAMAIAIASLSVMKPHQKTTGVGWRNFAVDFYIHRWLNRR